ncbi:ABC transporter permease [uncultured Thiohalocapsa sp.]|uniref:ABC transporter permease n=1 Tax=uncultured Thiohalocapsa sp. TaxID=768990 RepID=UPI0025DC9ADC|nr:ABC transporter permease [uncultured Thiohalocapsa sp.]
MREGTALAGLWRYRDFVAAEVTRQFRAKYHGSALGVSWTLLNPLATILIYTLVFSQLMGARLPALDSPFAYAIYVCAGLLTWGLLQDVLTRSVGLFIGYANLIKKVAFPTSTLLAIVVLTALLDFGLIFAVLLLLMAITGSLPGLVLAALLPLLALQFALATGLGLLVAVLNVFFRDLGHITAIALRLWFWLTPIVYPVTILPDWVRFWVQSLNPMAPLVGGYQRILLLHQWPEWSTLWLPTVAAAMAVLMGLSLYRARAGEMIDEL